ncbi:hypothetical protein FKM82_024764 [Ascaphus truei]
MLNLNFTSEPHINHINYLDITLFIDVTGEIQTDIYRKQNSRNTFLKADSNHPRSLIRGIPNGQFLCLRRLCSNEDSFHQQATELANRFSVRGCRTGDIQ